VSRRSVTAIPYVEGEAPPPGTVFVKVVSPDHPEGVPCWMRPEDMQIARRGPRPPLSPELRARSDAIYRKIGRGVLDWVKGKDDWASGFAADDHPEREIGMWEWIAAVFDAERKLRQNHPKRELKLLLSGLCIVASAPTGYGAAEAMAQEPKLANIPEFTRAVETLLMQRPANLPALPDGQHRVIKLTEPTDLLPP